MDLLEHAKDLVARSSITTQTSSHVAYLQTISQQESLLPKAKIKTVEPNNQNNSKSSNFNTLYLIGGLLLFGASILTIGYWWGKRKKSIQIDGLQEF